jgi:peptidoglycan/LPS O-acetylase OafA/YrhL
LAAPAISDRDRRRSTPKRGRTEASLNSKISALPAGKRNTALDGLRGLAALSVALGHCDLLLTGLAAWNLGLRDLQGEPNRLVWGRLAYLIFPSDAAVTLFFVLSGHVLWEAFFAKYPISLRAFPDYAVSRLYRLLPTSIACGVALGLASVIRGPRIGATELVETMMILSSRTNGVLWSLQIELVCSLLLFFVWMAARRNLFVLLAALLLSLIVTRQLHYANNYALFFSSFLAGALVTKLPVRASRNILLVLCGIPLLVGSSLVLGHDWRSRYGETLGAFMIVAYVRNVSPAFMRRGPAHFLGRISYPFYLSHIVGLQVALPVANRLGDAPLARFLGYAVISLAVTIPLAFLIHIAIEAPAMRRRPRLRWWSAR